MAVSTGEIMRTSDSVSLIVVFSCDRLPSAERYSLSGRTPVLDAGLREFKERFPLVELGRPNAASCSIDVAVPLDSVAEVIEYCEENRDRIRYVFDGPMLKAAKR